MWFRLRSPELAEDFERLMAGDRDIVRGSLDTVSDWRLTRPADVPGQAIDQADYVLIAEIVEVERWEQQASEHVQRLADDLAHLVSSRGISSCVPSFENPRSVEGDQTRPRSEVEMSRDFRRVRCSAGDFGAQVSRVRAIRVAQIATSAEADTEPHAVVRCGAA
jgi:hypothetical protein